MKTLHQNPNPLDFTYPGEKEALESAVALRNQLTDLKSVFLKRELTEDEQAAAETIYRWALILLGSINSHYLFEYLGRSFCAYMRENGREKIDGFADVETYDELIHFLNIVKFNMPLDVKILAQLCDA